MMLVWLLVMPEGVWDGAVLWQWLLRVIFLAVQRLNGVNQYWLLLYGVCLVMSDVNTILCVEDDELLRERLCQALSSAGYRVLLADDGLAALAILNTEIPDLILSDVTMPRMGGFALVETLAAQGGELAQVPFILLTALGDDQNPVRGRHLGVADFLVKPLDMAVMLSAVGARVKRRRRSDMALSAHGALNSRVLLLDLLESARRVVAPLTMLLLRLDAYLALSMRLTPAELDAVQQEVIARMAPFARQGMVFAWSEGCYAILMDYAPAHDRGEVLGQRMGASASATGLMLAYSCSALCIDVDWTAEGLRRLDASSLVEACALHLNFESAGNLQQNIRLGMADYQALEAARYAERHLGDAIRRDEFQLLFQPRVDLESGRIVGAEALVRWPNARIGALSPGFFVPAAERMGLAADLDRWVIRHSLAAIGQMRACDEHFVLSFNVSAQSLSGGIPAFLLDQLAQCPDDIAANLEIEVTETSMAHLTPAIETEIAALRAYGVTLAVDDFGMGYASLAYLKRLRAEVIKIDRSFVMDIAHQRIDAQIVEGLIGLGRVLGCTVVAEGVECAGQVQVLTALGCRYAQGYYFYRPLPLAELMLLLSEAN